MASRPWCKVILLLVVLAGLLHRAAGECVGQSQSCDECYDTLVDALLNKRNNKYHLRRVFYPIERSSPVFVVVTYQYNDSSIPNQYNDSSVPSQYNDSSVPNQYNGSVPNQYNESSVPNQYNDSSVPNQYNDSSVPNQYNDSSVPNQTWYWSAGIFYFLQPVEVFQFTSLFFGNPSWRTDEITLILPAECANAPEGFMTELTEQLKLYAAQLTHNPKIDNTFNLKAKGYNLITLNATLYIDETFYNAYQPYLLFCFQFLFPFLVIILVVMYSCFWLMKKVVFSAQSAQTGQVDKWTVDTDSWALTIAHAIISSTFILYVLGLDIAALAFRPHSPEYHNESYNALLFHYPGTLLVWDAIAVIIIISVLIAFITRSVIILLVTCWCADKCKLCVKRGEGGERHKYYIFLLLKLTGVVSLLVLAAHTHYIIIAWITDSLYATGIGINYAIFYVIHLVMLKKSCKRTIQCYDALRKLKSCQKESCRKVLLGCFVLLAVPSVWVVSLSFQVLVTVFFIYIPINHSIEETPSALLTLIQGTGAVFLGLIAWKVIIDPSNEAGTLSIISGALRKAIKNNDPNRELHSDPHWANFNDEEKLAEVLRHVIPLQ